MNYGSVNDDDQVAADRSFDENQAYYLKERQLTREQKIRKFSACAIPILAAILIIGGAAFYLLKDFNSLYPGHSGGNSNFQYPSVDRKADASAKSDTGSSSSSSNNSPMTPQTSGTSASVQSEEKHASDVASSCLAHEKCKGLVGECCPTLDGTFLLCCK